MDIDKRNRIISAVLLVVILVLSYVLYDAITTPYQEELAHKAMVNRVRTRMVNIRDGLIYYRTKKNKFPKELDSLLSFLKSDSLSIAMGDSLYGGTFKKGQFSFDSLSNSPRNGKRFEYALNDTIRPNIYLLKDPDSNDRIGSLERTTLLNAPSW